MVFRNGIKTGLGRNICITLLLSGVFCRASPVSASAAAPASPVAPVASTAELVDAASDRVEQRLGKQNNFYWGVASTAGGILALTITFLGFGAFRNIRQGLRDELRNELRTELLASAPLKDEIRLSVTKEIAGSFERSATRLERQIHLTRLQYLAYKVASADNFSNEERDGMLTQLLLIKDDPEIIRDPIFKTSLGQVIESFYAAHLWSRLDEIEENFSSVISTLPSVIKVMAMSYGLRILGEIDNNPLNLDRFHRYMKLLADNNYPERAFGYLLSYQLAWPTEGQDEKVTRLIELCGDLSEQDHAALGQFLDFWSDIEKVSRRNTSTNRRIVQKMAAARSVLIDAGILAPSTEALPHPETGA